MSYNYDFPWIDHKFITYASGYLEGFVWKSSNLANCRCNICGDSQKNKSKKRGFFMRDKGRWGYYCHNCGASYNLRKYLEDFFPSLYDQYIKECYLEKKNLNKKPPTPIVFKPTEPAKKQVKNNYPIEIKKCHQLADDHEAIQYLRKRSIDEKWFSKLIYVSDFARMVDPEKQPSADKRVVIPIIRETELIGMIGRTIVDRIPRYRNHKLVPEIPLYFNLDEINKDNLVMIVEGVFDSMFLPNAIAIGHSALYKYNMTETISNRVLIFDNQPRNQEVMGQMRRAVERNEPVCIWKKSFTDKKDINEMILSGKKEYEITNFILNNTYSGLRAKVEFGRYCEC
jgi:hypothetical protein